MRGVPPRAFLRITATEKYKHSKHTCKLAASRPKYHGLLVFNHVKASNCVVWRSLEMTLLTSQQSVTFLSSRSTFSKCKTVHTFRSGSPDLPVWSTPQENGVLFSVATQMGCFSPRTKLTREPIPRERSSHWGKSH